MGSNVAAGVGLLLGLMLIPIVMIIFLYVCLWKIYAKLGYPGWAALIPGYNLWIVANDFFGPVMAVAVTGLVCGGGALVGMFRDQPMFLAIGSLAELIGCVLWMIVWYRVVKELGHGFGFFLGCIFLSLIFYPILAFERYEPEYDDRY